MTREALRDAMLVSGELEKYKKTPNWEMALGMYKQATGNLRISLDCCVDHYLTIKKWLTK